MNDAIKRLRYVSAFLRKKLIHLNLQILYQCNFCCQICDFWKEPYRNMPKLAASHVRIISEKLCGKNPLIVSIGGGEPLLHPELTEIIGYLARFHFPVMICNGWYVTSEKAREIFKAGLYEVSISLDYADPAKHDLQRGVKGAFDHAVQALEILHKNRTYSHQRVHMISVVMDDNLNEIEPLIQLAKKIGVTYLVTLYSHGRGRKELKISQKDVSDYLLGLKKKYSNFVALRGYLSRFTESVSNNSGVVPCYAGKNLFNIDCQGNVTRCIDSLDDVAGNIIDNDLEVINQTLLKQYEANDCGHCWTSCRGNIETLMYGNGRIHNLMDSYKVMQSIPIVRDN